MDKKEWQEFELTVCARSVNRYVAEAGVTLDGAIEAVAEVNKLKQKVLRQKYNELYVK